MSGFTEIYAGMSDAGLLELAEEADGLEEQAREALRHELEGRGLGAEWRRLRAEAAARSAPREAPHEKLVTIAKFNDVLSANLAKAKLEADGIQALLPDENTLRLTQMATIALGRIRLQVAESDVARARLLLKELAADMTTSE